MSAAGNCLTCGNGACSRNAADRQRGGHRAFILDEIWPEYRAFLDHEVRPGDQILAPGLFGRAGLPRYDWGPGASHGAGLATLARHLAFRLVRDRPGAQRQPVYLEHDRRIFAALARRLDYHADRLVIDQRFLPFAWRAGVLGGRAYDVLMVRYPLQALHDRLDAMAGPASLRDYRAPDELVQDEAAALARAGRIVTPHHGIAGLFPGRALRLDWQRPPAFKVQPGRRVAFLGPVIGRGGLERARALARHLPEPLIVFGTDLEPGAFDGVAVERRAWGAPGLNGVGAIFHPAAMTSQPRRLLQAAAAGIAIHATEGAGLAPGEWLPLAALDAGNG